MTEIEQAIKEYDILIKGYEDDLLSDRYSDIVKEEFKRQRDIFLIGREALKEKAEREKGCEYCNKNFRHNYNWLIRDYMLNDKERPRIEITGDGIAVIECDYCPKCGRKLVSEE